MRSIKVYTHTTKHLPWDFIESVHPDMQLDHMPESDDRIVAYIAIHKAVRVAVLMVDLETGTMFNLCVVPRFANRNVERDIVAAATQTQGGRLAIAPHRLSVLPFPPLTRGQRQKTALDVRLAQGLCSATPPFGWMRGDPDTPLVPHPDEQRAVEYIRTRRTEDPDASLNAIARSLQAAGYRHRNAVLWNCDMVTKVCIRHDIPVTTKRSVVWKANVSVPPKENVHPVAVPDDV